MSNDPLLAQLRFCCGCVSSLPVAGGVLILDSNVKLSEQWGLGALR